MLIRLRNYALVAIGIGVFYFLLTHHILFSSFTSYDLLKKTEPTFKYTFISLQQIRPGKLLRVDALYDAGLGDYLLDNGFLPEEQFNRIMDRIEAEEAAREAED